MIIAVGRGGGSGGSSKLYCGSLERYKLHFMCQRKKIYSEIV